jgi:hypothetical protein
MTPAVPLSSQIFVHRFRKNADLVSYKFEHRSWRVFTGTQRTPRAAQVAKHERMTEPVVIPTAAPDRRSDAEAVKRLIQYDRAEIGQAEAASPTVAN